GVSLGLLSEVGRGPPCAEVEEALAQQVDGVGIEYTQLGNRQWNSFADSGDPQPMGMQEFKGWTTVTQFGPEPPDAEVPLVDVGIVEQNPGTARQLGQPALEGVLDLLVGMRPVNVQEIDRVVGEVR